MDARDWRPLTEDERAIVTRLLEVEFPGCEALLQQIPDARVRLVADYEDDFGSIEFEASEGKPARSHPATEALAPDSDGVPILYILHQKDGYLFELEIVKMDGTAIVRRPEADELVVSRCGELKSP